MHAGDEVQVQITPQYERLETPFQISEGIILPAGNAYTFTRHRVVATTASQRIVAVGAEYENGGFYSGRRREFILTLTARPLPGIIASVENEWNRLALAEGEFSTQVFRSVLNAQFSPWISHWQQSAVRHGQRHSRLAGALSLDSAPGQRSVFRLHSQLARARARAVPNARPPRRVEDRLHSPVL